MQSNSFIFNAIGTFFSSQKYTYDVPRQGILSEHQGKIVLTEGNNFEQALQELEGFERIWIIYLFHQNHHWKPMIRPPRGNKKVGVFASRAPYRPNPIGLSCVKLDRIKGRQLFVSHHDLLDGTPILDIKPYIPYADAFPNSSSGWIEQISQEENKDWIISYSSLAQNQIKWLQEHRGPQLVEFIKRELSHSPLSQQRKRIYLIDETQAVLSYRTWRIHFSVNPQANNVIIQTITSGYTPQDLLPDREDIYCDKNLHRSYRILFLYDK